MSDELPDELELKIPGYLVGTFRVPIEIRGIKPHWFTPPYPKVGAGETLHYWLENGVLKWRLEK